MALTSSEQTLIQSLVERLNAVEQNAKTLPQLPWQETMDDTSLIMVARPTSEGTHESEHLTIAQVIAGASMEGQDNKIREVLLGTITAENTLEFILDHTSLTVSAIEIVMLTALEYAGSQYIQRQYLWKPGKGTYAPIGYANIDTKLIVLPPLFPTSITISQLLSAPQAIAYDYGEFADTILAAINTHSPARTYADTEKIYYIRGVKGGISYLWGFQGDADVYGNGAESMEASDIVLIYSSANSGMPTAGLIDDYKHKFVAVGGVESFEIPANLKNLMVVVNEGRILQEIDEDYTYMGTTLAVSDQKTESGDNVFVSGVYNI